MGYKGSREKRMRGIYCCIPKEIQTKQADPFNYRLRSREEVESQMKYYPPTFGMDAHYKRYTGGDYRQNDDNNLDDRERVSKITFDIKEMNFQYL